MHIGRGIASFAQKEFLLEDRFCRLCNVVKLFALGCFSCLFKLALLHALFLYFLDDHCLSFDIQATPCSLMDA
jgi:hypothetical protein